MTYQNTPIFNNGESDAMNPFHQLYIGVSLSHNSLIEAERHI